jgi:hypothetical protein
MDYSCADEKRNVELRGEPCALPLLEDPNHPCEKQTINPGDAFEDIACRLPFDIVKF